MPQFFCFIGEESCVCKDDGGLPGLSGGAHPASASLLVHAGLCVLEIGQYGFEASILHTTVYAGPTSSNESYEFLSAVGY